MSITKLNTYQLNYPTLVYGRVNDKHGIDALIKTMRSKHIKG